MMGTKPRTVKGKSTDAYENVFILRARPSGENTISVKNLNSGASGNVIQYKIAAKANRNGGITEYIAGTVAAGVDITGYVAATTSGVKTHFVSHAWDEVIVMIISKVAGSHNDFQVDFHTVANNME
jgi:hypothetical protein